MCRAYSKDVNPNIKFYILCTWLWFSEQPTIMCMNSGYEHCLIGGMLKQGMKLYMLSTKIALLIL